MTTRPHCRCGHANPPRAKDLVVTLDALLDRRPELADVVHPLVVAVRAGVES